MELDDSGVVQFTENERGRLNERWPARYAALLNMDEVEPGHEADVIDYVESVMKECRKALVRQESEIRMVEDAICQARQTRHPR